MAIDKTTLDAITGGYKFYLDDMKSKNITGRYYDEIERLFRRIEELGQECSEINELLGKIQAENITVKMSDAYTRALTEDGNKKYMPKNGEIPDDSQLFKNNIDALRSSIQSLRDNYENLLKDAKESDRMRIMVDNNPEALIKNLEELIAVAEEPGMSYANFLRIQIERGLDKVAEGFTTRKFIEDIIESKKAFMEPEWEIKKWEEKLEEYNNEASKNKFNVVDTHVWNLIEDRIDRKYEPEEIKREKIYEFYDQILYYLKLWSLAHCPFAPTVAPWMLLIDYDKAVEAVKKDKATLPGIVREYEKLLYHYFGLRVKDIVRDETFIHAIKASTIEYSQELIEHLLLDVYPHCKPFNILPDNIIQKRGDIFKGNREGNPDVLKPYLRMKSYYASRYGEGYMEKKLDDLNLGYADKVKADENAAPWNLEAFLRNVDGKIAEPDLNETFQDNTVASTVQEATSTLKEKTGGLFSFFKR